VLAAVAVGVARLGARGRKPVGALVARYLAEARAGGREPVVDDGLAHPARRLGLTVRPVHGVQEAERLHRTLAQVAGVALKRRAAADVDVTPATCASVR